jgi:hypothetical protein
LDRGSLVLCEACQKGPNLVHLGYPPVPSGGMMQLFREGETTREGAGLLPALLLDQR